MAVSIGGAPEDPQFTIDDLLPHLGVEQSKKPLGEAIPGESLNLLIGSRPFKDDEGSDRVKLAVMDYLNQKYHIVEEDFISAELEVVPAFKAADIGFDRSLIGAYGHDDRVCGFACLAALLALGTPGKTAVCMLADKEEIGSAGVSGMKSAAFDTFVSDLCDAQRVPLKACYEKSFCLSTDVTAAYDPNFAEVYEKRNSARVNYGIPACASTPAPGASPGPPTPLPRWWPISAGCWTRPAWCGRWPSWARWTPAAAAPWPAIWPSATSTPSTRVCPVLKHRRPL